MALQEAILLGFIIVFSGQIYSVFTTQNVCKTYGSGVFETFNKTVLHLKSTCSVTLTHFTHAGVDCHIIIQRGQNGLMNRVEIIMNKVVTQIYNNTLTVEGSRISLPYEHTYQHVFQYGIYTQLRSKVLPLSVTWYSVSDGISSLWVQLDQDLQQDLTGLCGHQNSSETLQQLISDSLLSDGQCLTQDSVGQTNTVCRDVLSHAFECLGTKYRTYLNLCYKNMYGLQHREANCSFFKELSIMCGSSSPLWTMWRTKSNCSQPICPGDLHYMEMGPAFPPTCSNPQPYQELTSTCQPPDGKVLNDRVDTYYSINVEDCPCVHGKTIYSAGQKRMTKCQTCTCVRGKWVCSANTCPPKCIIEGQLITTFDGKQYSLLDRCTYVAARGLNWTLNIQFSGRDVVIEKAYLNINQERYIFSANNVQLNNIEINDLSQTEYATVFWQSSMFIQVQTSFGLKMQIQVSPEIQIYLYLPPTETTKGLCGTYNNDTSDDFTTFSGIIESSVQLFAQSWSMDTCAPIPGCINTDNEIFAEESCDQLKDPNGVFAVCHDYVPVSSFVEACVQKTCQCSKALEECVCVSFGNYAKACVTQGITVQEWRSGTNCLPSCLGNLVFGYSTAACNHTCRSLSGPDPTCDVADDPVEGCGCTEDTHLNNRHTCSPRPLCNCYHPGGVTLPGPVVIGGRQCMCENGQLHCPEECDCPVGKICVHCSQIPVNTAHKTCESLTKPQTEDYTCISGCFCPEGFFEDHKGGCVTQENCTCEFSGTVYETGQSVEANCKLCTCRGGEWSCIDEPCSGVCEVFGNGQYRTFDSKWYRFDGHCQYTLAKDADPSGHGQFTIKTESVPCCDESLTCSRAISVELLGEVTLLLSDMKVTETTQPWGTQGLLAEPLYSIHTVGMYIIISVPTLGLTVIWDKHTRVTIQLESQWRRRVLGLCGNFDGKVTNDLLTSSASEVFSVVDFGNSWKTPAPPCSDVITEMFPCERHSYCAAWAQRRCMILRSDTFKDCHLKVDPEPYYQACVLESCSCEFEGKFLGFCTAVAAYAEACSAKDICINWRTPDLCPVYCDYYNEADECTWHYNSCGQVKTCGTNNLFIGKLEGCYPRCPVETPYYDKNMAKCSTSDNCTCNFMNRVWSPKEEMCSPYMCCKCIEGNIVCTPTSTTTHTTTTYTSTAQPSTTTMNKTTTTKLPTKVYNNTRGNITPTELPTFGKTTATTQPPPTIEKTTKHTTTTQPLISESTTKHTTTTQPQTSERTTKYTTLTTVGPTESYTTQVEHTTTTQPPSSERTTKHTTSTTESTTEPSTTQPPSSVKTTESYSTPMYHTTTTQPPTSERTTEYTTSTTKRITESYTTPTEHTTTTQAPNTETTTKSYSTPMKYTTTTQSPTTERTTEYTTSTTKTTGFTTSTTDRNTEFTEYITQPLISESTTKHTTTTQPPTSERTTDHTTSTTEKTTESYTTPTEHSTTTQPPTSERPTEYTTSTTKTDTTPKSSLTPIKHTTTTQLPTSENTTDYTTLTTEKTTESYTTPTEHSTTTQPPTSERPTEYTTSTTKTTGFTTSTTEGNTEFTEYTTQPPISESTTKHTTTTKAPTSERTTDHTTSTTEKTTESYTTPIEHSTTTQPPTSETTHKSSSTLMKHTTTTQPPISEKITEYTTLTSKRTTESYTTQPPSSVKTTKSYSTPMDHTTTTQPPYTEMTTGSYTTPIENTTTTQPPSSVRTTESYSTTTLPTTMEHTTTTQQPTATTEKSTTFVQTPTTTTQTSTPVNPTKNYTTITQPTTEIVTTKVKYTTPVTTTTGITIITGPTTSKNTVGSQVKTMITTSSTTKVMPPIVFECRNEMQNQSWPNGATWREDCTDKVCRSGVIEVKPITCPTPEIRTDCPRDKKSLVKDKDTCCESWQCDCQCQLYGDPHYISFQGIPFDFMDNCTYTLVEEKVPIHHLSITVDNYFCEPDIDASCSRGIILKYWNDTVTLMITEEFMVESTLNQEIIKPPYENEMFKFESSGMEVSIYIKPIRSYVSLTPFNTLLINLASEHFLNNTQGQCGVCGGQSCIRRNGVVEDDSCCDKTAYDWVIEDPQKSYCKSPLRNISCISPPPIPPPPPCSAPICDLLHHAVFEECSKITDLLSVEKNCRFDYCSSMSTVAACSSLEYAASACKMIGICVDWRYLTNGSCEVNCPKGMIYDECRQYPNSVCQGGIPVPATSLVGVGSGCFCPDDQMLAEEHKQICVSECTKCKGPLGEPMPVGSVWESNCHICTCNNQTKTEECHPKPPTASPICSAYSILVSDCCNNQICVESSCEYNGNTYKVGDRWTDPLHPCESFSCSQTGTEIERTVCPQQTCAEDLRIWDEHHCCYSCNTTCAVRLTRINLTFAGCSQEAELPSCEGQCETQNRWVQSNTTLQLEQGHQSCKESTYEMREIMVTCNKSTPAHFTYKHVMSCECTSEI
ncbi:uncharacterized protein [Paramisgurnus dabryanus]|uniref:uncharacterized protein n=1 Tax=Paramisgurnus dabryanus TaxID=90735 RepID=UPI0031F3D67E